MIGSSDSRLDIGGAEAAPVHDPDTEPGRVVHEIVGGRSFEGARLFGLRLLFGLAVLVAWELASGHLFSARTFSSPIAIATQLGEWLQDGSLARQTWITLRTTIYGFLIGASTGIAAGLAIGIFRRIGDVVTPYIMVLYSLPKLALAPLFIVWFGIGTQMKVVMAAVLVFFLVFLNTVAGVRNIDQHLIDSLRVMGASNRDILRKLTLPGSMSYIILGLRMSVPYALIGAVVGELIATTSGLGYVIMHASAAYNTAGVFGALAVLGALAFAMNQAVEWLERKVLRWQPQHEGDRFSGLGAA